MALDEALRPLLAGTPGGGSWEVVQDQAGGGGSSQEQGKEQQQAQAQVSEEEHVDAASQCDAAPQQKQEQAPPVEEPFAKEQQPARPWRLQAICGPEAMRWWRFGSQVTVSFVLLLFCMGALVLNGSASIYMPILTGIVMTWCSGRNGSGGGGAARQAPQQGGDGAGNAAAQADANRGGNVNTSQMVFEFCQFLVQIMLAFTVLGFSFNRVLLALAQAQERLAQVPATHRQSVEAFTVMQSAVEELKRVEATYLPVISAVYGYFMPSPGRRN